MAKAKFSKQIYVIVQEGENDGEKYLIASDTHEEFDDGERVAVYKLVEIRVKRVKHELAK